MQYLSDEWFAAARQAIEGAGSTAPSAPIVIEQNVGEVRYCVTIERDGCSLVVGESKPADATFHQSRDTARAVATGETDAHQAFLLGRIRFVGDIDLLIERRDAFDWLHATLAPIMADTTFD